MKYNVEVITPRILSGEFKGQVKNCFVDGNFVSRDLKVGQYFNVMGGVYRIRSVIK